MSEVAHWLCPAPRNKRRACFNRLPCEEHKIKSPEVGMVLWGNSYLVKTETVVVRSKA